LHGYTSWESGIAPTGLSLLSDPYPALKRWAKLRCAYGAFGTTEVARFQERRVIKTSLQSALHGATFGFMHGVKDLIEA